jgi:hypothetical protein
MIFPYRLFPIGRTRGDFRWSVAGPLVISRRTPPRPDANHAAPALDGFAKPHCL